MERLKSLLFLALSASIGLALLVMACEFYHNWWPFFVLLFYIFAIVPTIVVQCFINASDSNKLACWTDWSKFLAVGSVISAFVLPIELWRCDVILDKAVYFTCTGNILIFVTMFIFFIENSSQKILQFQSMDINQPDYN